MQRARARVWAVGDLSEARVAALVALAFLAVAVLLMPRIMTSLDPITGDEPFYVVTAGSIIRDGDIDETNNWRNGDVNAWLPPDPLPPGWQGWPAPARGFPPHASETIRPGLYSKHGLGVAVMIVPALALGGRPGVVLFYALIGALVAANVYLLARQVGAGRRPALAITAALMLTTPLLPYSFLIFPELPGALLTLYAFRRLLAPENSRWQALAVGCCLGFLPWLHARFAIIAVALGIMGLARLARRETRLPAWALLAPAGLSAVGLTAFYWYFYGRPWPNTQDHAGMASTVGAWLNGLIGLLLDQQWGLLIHAPVYLLAAAGLLALARWRLDWFGWLALVVVPYYAFIGGYNQWWGEWCPPARYLATLAPLAAAPIGALWASDRTRLTGGLVALLSLPGLIVMAAFVRDPRWMYNHPSGQGNLINALNTHTGLPFTSLVPSFVNLEATSTTVRLVWLVGLAALVVLSALATLDLDGGAAGPAAVTPPRGSETG
jgi:hypothetical protein